MAPVVVAEVLIPQRQPEHALVDSLQQQGATIGGHAAAVKASAHLTAALIGQIDCDTVCAHGVCLWLVPNLLNINRLSQIHTSCSRPW